MENDKLRVRYTGEYYKYSLRKGKVYDVVIEEGKWYAIVDESGEEYVFPKYMFEIVKKVDEK